MHPYRPVGSPQDGTPLTPWGLCPLERIGTHKHYWLTREGGKTQSTSRSVIPVMSKRARGPRVIGVYRRRGQTALHKTLLFRLLVTKPRPCPPSSTI